MGKKLIPFGMTMQAMFLKKGTTLYKRAEAEYLYEGEELEYKLLDIDTIDHDSIDYKTRLLKLDLKYKKISDKEYEYKLLDIAHSLDLESTDYKENKLKLDLKFGVITDEEYDYNLLDIQTKNQDTQDYKISKLKLDLKYEKIDEQKYEKEESTIMNKPWVKIIGTANADEQDLRGVSLELDWNELFIEELKEEGYSGLTDEAIINQYIGELCYNIAREEGIIDDMIPMDNVPSMGPKIKSKKNDDNTIEFS